MLQNALSAGAATTCRAQLLPNRLVVPDRSLEREEGVAKNNFR